MAVDQDAIDAAITTALTTPLSVSTPTGSMTNRSISELLDARDRTAGDSGSTEAEFFGIRVRKARFNRRGSCSDEC